MFARAARAGAATPIASVKFDRVSPSDTRTREISPKPATGAQLRVSTAFAPQAAPPDGIDDVGGALPRQQRADLGVETPGGCKPDEGGQVAVVGEVAPRRCRRSSRRKARHREPLFRLWLTSRYDYFCWLGEDDAPAPASYPTSEASRLTPEPRLPPCARAPLRTRSRRVGRPSLAINSDHAVHLPITFDQTNHIKTDIEMVKNDRKAKKAVRTDRRLTSSGKPSCYV